ncbi:serine/threonine-protein kinase [Streptomyces sp. NPDC098781]|uniref:serine/threonine-protein kinase n=1 Tax=Streptomyces sp. NPDC098781 TaxID=3366097 RepID=UPI0038224067
MVNEDALSGGSGSECVIAGRYRLLSPLGAGGMGTVWRASDKVLHREVAVKEVRAPAGLAAPDIERMYTRLEREAWAAARVAHRNVVTVYDVVMEGDRPWIVMELVRGESLADLLKAEGQLTPPRAAAIGLEVLAALRAAHETGVLHRDVKPANVLIAKDGRVVLTDFGIAMIEGDSALTMTGEVVGSPEFLAPERALGRQTGPASDLWSLGVLLYAAVEASSPFRQNTPLSTLRAIVDEELPPARRAGALTPVIEGLLRKDPDQRLTAEQAKEHLRLIANGGVPEPGSVPPPAESTAVSAQLTTLASPAHPAIEHPTTQSLAQTAIADPAVPNAVAAGALPVSSGRSRRRTGLLAAGAALCALALTGVGYALTDNANESQQNAGNATTPGAGDATAPNAGGDQLDASNDPGTHVTVTSAQPTYVGRCPAPSAQAPTITATFSVDRLPAHVTYRWVSEDGSVTDPRWRTLVFPSGQGHGRQDTVRLTTWAKAGKLETRIGVELKPPLQGKSNVVPVTLMCDSDPTRGTSPAH